MAIPLIACQRRHAGVTPRRTMIGVAMLIGTVASHTCLAQGRPSASRAAPHPATIDGVVFDSLARKPLVAAVVELVNIDSLSAPARHITSDTLGAFRFDGVRPGRYLIGFMHPLLDSVGVEQTPRAVIVDGLTVGVRIDLALPSPLSLRAALCGAAAVVDSQSLILGIVRDAGTRAAVASATVAVEWANLTLAAGGLRRSTERRTFATQETGWFALCGAPATGMVVLTAAHDADSTEALELEMPASGFLRRDLYFGVARPVAADATPRLTDSLTITTGPRRAGDGRLSGTVVAADGERPLARARVSIRNGPTTVTDDGGAFTLSGIPTGTRMLDVRAVSYAPVELPVDVVEGGSPLRIVMASLKSVLDTVKVRANLSVSRNYDEFLKRRKHSGAGRFITTEEIAERNPIDAMDLFRGRPGIIFARDSNQFDILAQRSPQNFSYPFCRVAVFVNGNPLREPTVNDLNTYLRSNELLGVEIYDAGAAPVQFSRRNGCGAVVIWTK